MWAAGQRFWPHCLRWACVCWTGWMRPALPIFAAVWLLMAPGCCSPSSTPDPPWTLPVLTSLQRLDLNGVPGVWMNTDDAGQLAAWLYTVTGEGGAAVR